MDNKLETNVRWNLLKYILIGVWILFLYVLFLLMVFFSLGIYQFQQGFADISFEEPPISVERFEDHTCDVSGLKNVDFKRMSSSVITLPCLRRAATNKGLKITVSSQIRNIKFQRSLYEEKKKMTISSLKELKKQYAARMGYNLSDDVIKNNDICNLNRQELKELKGLEETEETEELTEAEKRELTFAKENCFAAGDLLTSYENALAELNVINMSIQKVASDSEFYQRIFSPVLGRGNSIVGNDKNKDENKDENEVGPDTTDVWAIPETFLSLLLALSMGGLGSLITVTTQYLKIDKAKFKIVRFSNYLFRPMLGAITALAVYIAIKSGQIGVGGESATELSPYLLSFICVLAGLMAEPVYKRLTSYAEKLL